MADDEAQSTLVRKAAEGSARATVRTVTRRGGLSTGLLFAVAAAIVAVCPLIYLPLVTGSLGAAGFRDLALGQSIGAAAAVLVGLGWSFVGPVTVARASALDRALLLRQALALQGLVAIVVLLPALAVTAYLAASFHLGAVLATAAAVVLGIFPTWYMIGIGRGSLLVLYDALPKLIGATVGGAALFLFQDLWPLPLAQIVVSSVALTALLIRVRAPSPIAGRVITLRKLVTLFREQMSFSLAQIASSVYINLPITMLAATGAPGLAVFAAGDRYLRLSAAATSPLTQTFQGWVPRAPTGVGARIRVSLWTHAAVGLLAFPVLLVATPLIQRFLFSDEVDIPVGVSLAFAGAFVVITLNKALGVVALPNLGRRRTIALSALSGAIVGTPAIIVLGARYGAVGGAIGVLIAEAAVLLVQVFGLVRGLRALGEHRPNNPLEGST